MNRKILIVLMAVVPLFLASAGSSHAAQTMLGWSSEQDAAWTKLKNTNNKLWTDLLARADSPTFYDGGVSAALAYRLTGEVAYARKAWENINHFCGRSYVPVGSTCDIHDGEPYSDDETRKLFGVYAKMYPLLKPALSAKEISQYKDILDHWADLTLNQTSRDFAPRTSDSDALSIHYLSLMLYAIAIKDEDPARYNEVLHYNDGTKVNVGGLDSTGANRETWRNCITDYVQRAKGGQWLESTQYNISSFRQIMEFTYDINQYYGTDKFPEVTELVPDFEKAVIAELTPGLRDSFQWSDTEEPHGLRLIYRPKTMAILSFLTKNPVSYFLFDRFYEGNGSIPDISWFSPDPDARRSPPADGYDAYYAPGRGLAYYREGWDPDNSFFASAMFSRVDVDHEVESLTNFGLYRKGHWAVDYPRGYSNSQDMAWYNHVIAHGGIPSTREARGSIVSKSEPGYSYHIGTTGGHLLAPNFWDPAPEALHEYTRSYLYLHNNDGSDSVVIFDRLKSTDPRTLPNFNKYAPRTQRYINAAGGKHQWIIQTPTNEVSQNNNVFSWTDEGGEKVSLITFMTDYNYQVYDDSALRSQGLFEGYPSAGVLKYQLRIIPNGQPPFQTFLNVVHVGSNAAAQAVNASSGEKAKGALLTVGNQSKLAVFNGTQGADIPGTPTVNSRQVYDPEKFDKISKLHWFRSGFTMTVPTKSVMEVFLADLDPAYGWSAKIDNETTPISVGPEGLAHFTIPQSINNHEIIVSSGRPTYVPTAAFISSVNLLSVTFDASSSSDPNGDALNYLWDFGDGQISTQKIVVHAYATAGTYTVKLTVSNGNSSDTEIKTITVASEPGSTDRPPVLNLVGNQSVLVGERLTFDITASDPDSSRLTLSAALSNGSDLSVIGASFTDHGDKSGSFDWTPTVGQGGQYTVVFKVSDGSLTDTEQVVIRVSGGSENNEYHWLEAEYADSLAAPLRIEGQDFGASELQYIAVPVSRVNYTPDSGVMASFSVDIVQEGDYVIFIRDVSRSWSENSVFIQVDNGADNLSDLDVNEDWHWDQVNNRGGDNPVIFHLTSGSHTIKVKAREEKVLVDKILITNNLGYSPSGMGEEAENIPTEDPSGIKIWMEAEAGEVIAPMVTASDPTASGGKYVYAPNASGDQRHVGGIMVALKVNVATPGVYVLWSRTIAPNLEDNSFFVQMDTGYNNLWDVPSGPDWQWSKIRHRGNPDVKFNLSVGEHTIKFMLREDGTKLDKVLLTNDLHYRPSGM